MQRTTQTSLRYCPLSYLCAGGRYIHKGLASTELDHMGGDENILANFLNFREGLETSDEGCEHTSSCSGTSGCDEYALDNPASFLKYIKTFQEKYV